MGAIGCQFVTRGEVLPDEWKEEHDDVRFPGQKTEVFLRIEGRR